MAHGHKIEIKEENFIFTPKAKKFTFMLLGLGLLLTIVGFFTMPKENHHAHDSHHAATEVEKHDNATHAATKHHVDPWGDNQVNNPAPPPQVEDPAAHKPWYSRVYATLLVNSYFFLIISITALFFVGLQYIANAGWSASIKRVPEAMASFLPIAAIVMIVVLILGKDYLYHWAHYEHEHLKPGDAGFDKILNSKLWFLNSKMFIGGIIIIPLIWFLFKKKLQSLSVREDKEGGVEPFKLSIKWSAGFTFIFAFSFSILSWLVIMSVDAHWYSTIFSIYNFATGFVSALAIIVLTVLFLKSQGYLNLVTDEHIHDLGKFMFAFSVFWTYIWLSQYLLIWYAQIPEEVMYYQNRFEAKWSPFFFINIVLNFIIPFLFLMTRDAKRNPKILVFVGTIILLGHWNDVFLMVMPGSIGSWAGIGLFEIGSTMVFAGGFIYMLLSSLSKQSLVPVNHPYIEESAHHDVGV